MKTIAIVLVLLVLAAYVYAAVEMAVAEQKARRQVYPPKPPLQACACGLYQITTGGMYTSAVAIHEADRCQPIREVI